MKIMVHHRSGSKVQNVEASAAHAGVLCRGRDTHAVTSIKACAFAGATRDEQECTQ